MIFPPLTCMHCISVSQSLLPYVPHCMKHITSRGRFDIRCTRRILYVKKRKLGVGKLHQECCLLIVWYTPYTREDPYCLHRRRYNSQERKRHMLWAGLYLRSWNFPRKNPTAITPTINDMGWTRKFGEKDNCPFTILSHTGLNFIKQPSSNNPVRVV